MVTQVTSSPHSHNGYKDPSNLVDGPNTATSAIFRLCSSIVGTLSCSSADQPPSLFDAPTAVIQCTSSISWRHCHTGKSLTYYIGFLFSAGKHIELVGNSASPLPSACGPPFTHAPKDWSRFDLLQDASAEQTTATRFQPLNSTRC